MKTKLLILFLFPLSLFGQDRLMGDSTFGTIEKGSNVITLMQNPGFQVGDFILIPTTANRGEVGIGDAWPSKRFNTLAELQSANLQPGEYVGCLEDGYVYRDKNKYTQWDYYTAKIIPHGLKAKIISIDGLTLTLDKSAFTTVTNVPVFYDNEPFLNKAFNYRDDWDSYPDDDKYFEFPPGRYAIGNKVYVQKTFKDTIGKVEINGNGATLFSPSGFPSASLSLLVNNATVHDLNVHGNFKDNGYGFDSYPTFEYWENPYEQLPAILFTGKNGLGYNLHVKNAPGYSFQIFNNSFIRNSSIILEEGIRSYTGWQMLAVGATKGAGFRNITFYAPYISNAMEAARSTDVIFDSITLINGMVAFNSTGGTKFTNSTITWTKDGRQGSFINNGHPQVDINGYMALYDGAADYSQQGGLIENVHFIQECFTPDNDVLRSISAGDGVKNFTVKNCTFTRPNFTNVHSNQQVIFFSEALNNTIENIDIKGTHTLHPDFGTGTIFRSDITMGGTSGTGLIKNVTGAGSIIAALGVNVENSPVQSIINQTCDVLALDPREKDTIARGETVLLFPNPSDNHINIKSKTNGQVFLYNSLGQQVKVNHSFNGQFIKVEIKHLPKGLYYVQLVRNREYNISLKFIRK